MVGISKVWNRDCRDKQARLVAFKTSRRRRQRPIISRISAILQGLFLGFQQIVYLSDAVRCSLETFGMLEHADKDDSNTLRHVCILPLYVLSQLQPGQSLFCRHSQKASLMTVCFGMANKSAARLACSLNKLSHEKTMPANAASRVKHG